jgi:CheY-like chemotaxis protein
LYYISSWKLFYMSQPKLKILLVEDDPVLGYVVKDYLQKQEYEVTHCTDGDAAWHQFMKNIFDICLLDIMLPGKKDGMEPTAYERRMKTYLSFSSPLRTWTMIKLQVSRVVQMTM